MELETKFAIKVNSGTQYNSSLRLELLKLSLQPILKYLDPKLKISIVGFGVHIF